MASWKMLRRALRLGAIRVFDVGLDRVRLSSYLGTVSSTSASGDGCQCRRAPSIRPSAAQYAAGPDL